MARKARKGLKDTAKLLGGLGTAYVLSEALGPKVELKDVNQADAALDAEKRAAETKKHLIAEAGMPLVAPQVNVAPKSKARSYEDIKADEILASSRSYGQGPIEAYKRLQKDSEEGTYASPVKQRGSEDFEPAGDLGKYFAKGGVVSASKRADGCAQRGKTRGKMV
jgi:hypothetical protein